MLSDAFALIIGLIAAVIAKRSTSKNTFGWARAEVLGSLFNSVFLSSMCLSMAVEAVKHLFEPHPLKDINLILYTGIIGLIINLLGLLVFGHGHSHGVSHEEDLDTSELNDCNNVTKTSEFADKSGNAIELEIRAVENDALVRTRVKLDDQPDDKYSTVVKTKKKNKNRCCKILCKSDGLNF